jgi:hypothetical protein
MKASTEEQILAKVKAQNPKVLNPRIKQTQDRFLDGKLYTVAFEHADQGTTEFINRAYVHGKNIDIFGFDNELLAIVGTTHGTTFLRRAADPMVVSSIIAMCVTLVVCGLGIYGALAPGVVSIPEFLSSGFLLILGFYFGKSVGTPREE